MVETFQPKPDFNKKFHHNELQNRKRYHGRSAGSCR